MGQGAPETGPLPGAPSRDFQMSIEDALLEYAPVTVSFTTIGNPHLFYHKMKLLYVRSERV